MPKPAWGPHSSQRPFQLFASLPLRSNDTCSIGSDCVQKGTPRVDGQSIRLFAKLGAMFSQSLVQLFAASSVEAFQTLSISDRFLHACPVAGQRVASFPKVMLADDSFCKWMVCFNETVYVRFSQSILFFFMKTSLDSRMNSGVLVFGRISQENAFIEYLRKVFLLTKNDCVSACLFVWS